MKRLAVITVFATVCLAAQAQGVRNNVPEGLTFPTDYPMAWSADKPFGQWRAEGRAKVLELLGRAPEKPISTGCKVLCEERREGYIARKIEFEIEPGLMVRAYLLVPDGKGPFPALVALHDHGAEFAIGKEKMIRPIGESAEVDAKSAEWAEKCYDGRFTGDFFASNGYVVLAVDAVLWGNRGEGDEGRRTRYDTQQAVAANCMKAGTTLCGLITYDDLRSIDFLAAQPDVDAARIGVYGHSMGGHRAWLAAALSDKVAAAAATCWMATSEALSAEGNNELKGGSAYTMLIPYMSLFLDNPDIASLASPKPLFMAAGRYDPLFPAGTEEAFDKMHPVWRSQGASENLVTRFYPEKHFCSRRMQADMLTFFDSHLKK